MGDVMYFRHTFSRYKLYFCVSKCIQIWVLSTCLVLLPLGAVLWCLVCFRCHMTFGDKPRHDGEAGTTQSVRLWKKASLFSILSITHRSEVQLMQDQRRWKDNSIVYNFDVDTMVKFRIMKEHGVFLR